MSKYKNKNLIQINIKKNKNNFKHQQIESYKLKLNVIIIKYLILNLFYFLFES